jgi:hypothetical protein
MFSILKKIFFWSYARNTWQYDLLCLLILAFIFLTPQDWFENKELRYRKAQRSAPIVLLAGPEDKAELDHRELERRVRIATGRADAIITGVRPRRDSDGKIVAYEVDIH